MCLHLKEGRDRLAQIPENSRVITALLNELVVSCVSNLVKDIHQNTDTKKHIPLFPSQAPPSGTKENEEGAQGRTFAGN